MTLNESLLKQEGKLSLLDEQPRAVHFTSKFKLYDQANKRIRWMPRQLEATKDVVVCDKLGGADKQALYPEISEWGNPTFWVIFY